MSWTRSFKETGVENVYMPMFHSGKPSGERERSCRRFCTGSCMGNTWRFRAAYRRDCVYVRLLRLCSAISMQKTYILTVTCRRYTTSGVLLYVGRRPPVRSCVPESSYGRKDIPLMQPLRKQRQRTDPDVKCIRRFLRGGPGNSGYPRTEDRQGEICRCRGYLHHRVPDA